MVTSGIIAGKYNDMLFFLLKLSTDFSALVANILVRNILKLWTSFITII